MLVICLLVTNLQRDLIVFEKTDDLLLLFLFRNGTAKLNEKNNNKKSISSYAAINTYNTVYPVLCTHMLLSYYEFPNIYHSMYFLSPRLFGVSAFHLHFQQYSIIFLKSFYFSWWLTEIVFTETPVSLSLKLPRNIARVNSRLHCSVQLRNVRVFVIMIDLLSFYFSTALFRTELSSWSGMLLYLLCPM